jgi:hypothetical protein
MTEFRESERVVRLPKTITGMMVVERAVFEASRQRPETYPIGI